MIYSQKNNFIFFHIPKTAGTSISNALQAYGDTDFQLENYGWNQHIKPLDFLQMTDKEMSKLYKFAFVRNPYDRLISLYRFLKGSKSNPTYNFIKSSISYKDWLFNYYPNSKDRQYHWTHDSADNLLLDHIAKYENIKEELEFLSDRLQININIGWSNKSFYNDGAHNDSECISFINELLLKEFQLLNYEKA